MRLQPGAVFHVAAVLLAAVSPTRAVTVPAGFVAHEVATNGGWVDVVGLEIAPDGRLFVIEKRGRVHVVEDNVKLPAPFLDLETEVLNNGDRGLLAIALDPDFAANGFVYLHYVVDPNGDGVDDDGPSFSRLTRYQASSADRNVADPASRHVLLGADWATGIPAIHDTHTVGSLRFGEDGTLLLSAGEAAHADTPDPGGRDPAAFGTGKLPLSEDIGAFRSQWLGSLAGKVLRLDPATGGGLPSNPYYTGNPSDNASRVWAYGLRNPFRFRVRPGTGSADPAEGRPGTLYVGDVGWVTWEEVGVVRGGENFGWPCREGFAAADGYPALTPAHHGCGTIGTPENPALTTDPLLAWHHADRTLSTPPGLQGKCASGVAFYTGTSYPAPYQGACFFADYDGGWIKVARVDAGDQLVSVLDFATECFGPVDLTADPVSGDLFYVSIIRNEIRRIRFDTTNRPPVARAAATPLAGAAPLVVQFSSAGTSDPDLDPLTYHWSFGDGATATGSSPSHTYAGAGDYTATLTADDARGGLDSATVAIAISGPPGNTPPVPAIQSPLNYGLFQIDAELVLEGSATDAEDPPGSLTLAWEVILHHNTHVHPAWLTLAGPRASFTPRSHDDGTGTWFEVVLRATDSGGLTGTARVFTFPDGAPLLLDDGDPGTSSTGTWLASSASLPYGDGSRYSKVAGAQYTYTFAVTVPGQYKVYAWWTLLNTRTTAAPYTITHARGSDTVIVDQRNPAFGDRWNLLGTYALDGTARVTITAVGGNLTTSADAIALLPARDAVLDNGRNGTAFTGGWSISGGANSYGENSVYSRSPGKTYSYNLSPPWTGVADVYAWWTSLPSRPIDAPYTIAYATGAHVVRVNQTAAGGRWNYLGTYAFNGTARVTVTATSNTVSTGADAVRLAPRPGDLILDEDSPGISRTGAWAVSGGASHYGVLARYSKDRVSTYTYPFALAAPGDYEVFAWWTTISSRSSSVPYHITHASGTTTVLRDQLVDGGRWNSLGTYTFGATARVTIETRADGKSYCADAIRIRKVAP